MSISFKGFNVNNATFECDDDISKGAVVKMSGNGKVCPAENNDSFIGVNVCSRYYDTTVQLAGYAECTYSGTAPTVGYAKLCADANGGVKVTTGETGILYRILTVNTTAKTVGFIL